MNSCVKWEMQKLPCCKIFSQTVAMCCIVGTFEGLVFVGGQDGRIYELYYKESHKAEIRTTGDHASDLLPSFLTLILRTVKSIVSLIQLVVDKDRTLIYAVGDTSKIQAFGFGKKVLTLLTSSEKLKAYLQLQMRTCVTELNCFTEKNIG